MAPAIIDRTTLIALAIILMIAGAVVFAALSHARGWTVRIPRRAAAVLAVVVLVGLSIWHDEATDIQIESCSAVFETYMGRDDYATWSTGCSEVMLSAAVKDKSVLAGLCVDNASALLSGGSMFESRFVFQENYCRKALGSVAQAEVAASIQAHCRSAQIALVGGSRDGLAAYARLCPDESTMTKAALPR